MQLRDFVMALRVERDTLLATYSTASPTTRVGEQLRQAALTESQRKHVIAAVDAALTDAFYTILLGLDGAASLGGVQQAYRIEDERGDVISKGDGNLEAVAWELFQVQETRAW